MSYDNEFARLIKVCRIVGSIWLLLAGAWVVAALLKIPKFVSIIENMVEGGRDSLPWLPKQLIEHQMPLLGAAALATMGCLWGIWLSRRISNIVLIVGLALPALLLLVLTIDNSMSSSLTNVVAKFSN